MMGAFVPWIVNILYISPLAASFMIDPTPMAFLVTGAMFTWGIFSYRLIDISPVARNWVIEQMDDGMFVIDKLNRVVDVNPAAAGLLNKSPNQVIGQPIEVVFAEWPDLVARYRDVARANTDIQLNNGERTRYFNLSISPLLDKQQRVNGRLILVYDNTEQHKAELELRGAKNAAEAASRAKSTFLANMSHELRTPLAAIIGYSELMQEQSKMLGNDTIPRRLEKINISAAHLLNIINDLLDLSKVEAGQMTLNLYTFSIPSVIEGVQAAIQPLMEKNQNSLTINMAADLGTMRADQAKLHQILLNILHNAAKFTKGGEIHLAVAKHPKDASKIMFKISDNGIGMTQTQIDQLFRPFFQADLSTTKRFGGTGLGLVISFHLCQLMQGEIFVTSQPDEGSCFTIWLPTVVQEDSSPRETTKALGVRA